MMMYMNRLSRRLCGLALLVCVGCAAQSSSPDLDRRIERQIRVNYSVPPQVGIVVGARKPDAEFTAYDDLVVSFVIADKKQDQNFLLSKDGKTLIRMTRLDLTKDPYSEAMSKIDLSGRPVRGGKDAKVTIVNYDDFQCPFCARMHETLNNEILKEYGDKIKLVYKDFPLVEIHPWAKHAAIDANCLAKMNQSAYWDFADAIHANAGTISKTQGGIPTQFEAVDKLALDEGKKAGVNADELQACVKAQKDDKVTASMAEAELMGVDSTPTIFVNGQKLSGAVPGPELKAIIDKALMDAGVQAPAATSQKSGSGGK
jgi:protein-disulfide isomerase